MTALSLPQFLTLGPYSSLLLLLLLLALFSLIIPPSCCLHALISPYLTFLSLFPLLRRSLPHSRDILRSLGYNSIWSARVVVYPLSSSILIIFYLYNFSSPIISPSVLRVLYYLPLFPRARESSLSPHPSRSSPRGFLLPLEIRHCAMCRPPCLSHLFFIRRSTYTFFFAIGTRVLLARTHLYIYGRVPSFFTICSSSLLRRSVPLRSFYLLAATRPIALPPLPLFPPIFSRDLRSVQWLLQAVSL